MRLGLAILLLGGAVAGGDTASLLRQTRTLTMEGRWDAALAALDAAAAKGGDARSAAARKIERGRVLTEKSFLHRKNPGPARTALEEGLRLAKAAGDEAASAEATMQLGRLDYNEAFETRDWKKPRAVFESVLGVRERLGERRGISETLFYVGLTYEQDGQPAPAMERYEKSLVLSEAIGDLALQSYARRHMAGIQEERGELSAAEKNIAAEIELRRRAGFAVGVPFALMQQADFLAAHGGDPKEVDRLLEEAAAGAEKCGVTRALAAARTELSRRAAAAGDTRRAFILAEQALAAARAYGGASEIRAAEALVGDARRGLPN